MESFVDAVENIIAGYAIINQMHALDAMHQIIGQESMFNPKDLIKWRL
jgi:hypothetical protein